MGLPRCLLASLLAVGTGGGVGRGAALQPERLARMAAPEPSHESPPPLPLPLLSPALPPASPCPPQQSIIVERSSPLPPFPPPSSEPTTIPRALWLFWDSPALPEFVAACIAALRRTNPAWKVTVLSAESAQANFSLPPPPGLPSGATPTKQQLADWYRLAVLERYGGVYMDATNVNFRSVEHWVDVRSLAVQGFNRPANVRVVGQDEVMENWAIAAPPNSTFVRVWLAHFADALRRGPDEWAADQLRTPGQELLLSGLNSYLAEHIAWYAPWRVCISRARAATRALAL